MQFSQEDTTYIQLFMAGLSSIGIGLIVQQSNLYLQQAFDSNARREPVLDGGKIDHEVPQVRNETIPNIPDVVEPIIQVPKTPYVEPYDYNILVICLAVHLAVVCLKNYCRSNKNDNKKAEDDVEPLVVEEPEDVKKLETVVEPENVIKLEDMIPLAERTTINEILTYWYPGYGDRNYRALQVIEQRWFGAALSDEMKIKCTAELEALSQGQREHWLQDRDGLLTYVLLADQFAASILRDFELLSINQKGLIAARLAIESSQWGDYKFLEQLFFIVSHPAEEARQQCFNLRIKVGDTYGKDSNEFAEFFDIYDKAIQHREDVRVENGHD